MVPCSVKELFSVVHVCGCVPLCGCDRQHGNSNCVRYHYKNVFREQKKIVVKTQKLRRVVKWLYSDALWFAGGGWTSLLFEFTLLSTYWLVRPSSALLTWYRTCWCSSMWWCHETINVFIPVCRNKHIYRWTAMGDTLSFLQKPLSAEVQYIIPTNHACSIVTHHVTHARYIKVK